MTTAEGCCGFRRINFLGMLRRAKARAVFASVAHPSTFIAIMAESEANKPLVLEMCASSVHRCKKLVEELALIEGRLMS